MDAKEKRQTVSAMLAELQADILAAIEVPTADVDLASFLKWNSQVARPCGLTGAGPCFQFVGHAPLRLFALGWPAQVLQDSDQRSVGCARAIAQCLDGISLG